MRVRLEDIIILINFNVEYAVDMQVRLENIIILINFNVEYVVYVSTSRGNHHFDQLQC